MKDLYRQAGFILATSSFTFYWKIQTLSSRDSLAAARFVGVLSFALIGFSRWLNQETIATTHTLTNANAIEQQKNKTLEKNLISSQQQMTYFQKETEAYRVVSNGLSVQIFNLLRMMEDLESEFQASPPRQEQLDPQSDPNDQRIKLFLSSLISTQLKDNGLFLSESAQLSEEQMIVREAFFNTAQFNWKNMGLFLGSFLFSLPMLPLPLSIPRVLLITILNQQNGVFISNSISTKRFAELAPASLFSGPTKKMLQKTSFLGIYFLPISYALLCRKERTPHNILNYFLLPLLHIFWENKNHEINCRSLKRSINSI